VTQPLPDVEDGPCTVCGEQTEAGAAAICNGCGKTYHLVLTQNTEGKDCGEVWLNEEFLALEFGCARCLAEQRGEQGGQLDPPPAAPPPAPPDPGPPQRIRVKHQGISARDIVRRKRR